MKTGKKSSKRGRAGWSARQHPAWLSCVVAITLASCSDGTSTSEAALSKSSAGIVGAPLAWAEHSKLEPNDGTLGDGFGYSVALSGNVALVGAPFRDDAAGTIQGGAYVFSRSGSTWVQEQELYPAHTWEFFGYVTAIVGETGLVGAVNDDSCGAVYVYDAKTLPWKLVQKVIRSGNRFLCYGDRFGDALALNGETLLIGAHGYAQDTGTVFVFTKSGSEWLEQGNFSADDGVISDRFGASVQLSGDTALIGAPGAGAVYAFQRSGSTWTQQAKLKTTQPQPSAYYGIRLNVDMDTMLVGASLETGSGAAHVFTRTGTSWTEQATLAADPPLPEGYFGYSVSLQGDLAVVGSPGPVNDPGAAYVYEREQSTWKLRQRIHATRLGSNFGAAVSLSGTSLLVGDSADGIAGVGAAYVFEYGPANGSECAADEDCASSKCVQGMCCNQRCEGICESCLASLNGSEDGFCSPVSPGTDPREQCAAGVGTCALTGSCDGAGACAFTSSCGTPGCSSDTEEMGSATCMMAGVCSSVLARACQPGYRCVDIACKTTCIKDSDCDGPNGYECQNGECLLVSSNGDGGSFSGGAGGQGAAGFGGIDAQGGGAGGTQPQGGDEFSAGHGMGGESGQPSVNASAGGVANHPEGAAGDRGPTAGDSATTGGKPGQGAGGKTNDPSAASNNEEVLGGERSYNGVNQTRGGCACATTSSTPARGMWWLLTVAMGLGWKRRGERRRLAVACGGGQSYPRDTNRRALHR